MTSENGERNTRGMLNLIGIIAGAVGAAYLVFLWLN